MQHKPDALIMILLFILLLSSVLLVKGEDKVAICHIAHGNLENTRTIYVNQSKVAHYLSEGDLPGTCESQSILQPANDVAATYILTGQ